MEILGDKAKKFTNVYIKNFGDGLTEEKLRDLFEQYGKIVSAKVGILGDWSKIWGGGGQEWS